jgi:hypothetical protein
MLLPPVLPPELLQSQAEQRLLPLGQVQQRGLLSLRQWRREGGALGGRRETRSGAAVPLGRLRAGRSAAARRPLLLAAPLVARALGRLGAGRGPSSAGGAGGVGAAPAAGAGRQRAPRASAHLKLLRRRAQQRQVPCEHLGARAGRSGAAAAAGPCRGAAAAAAAAAACLACLQPSRLQVLLGLLQHCLLQLCHLEVLVLQRQRLPRLQPAQQRPRESGARASCRPGPLRRPARSGPATAAGAGSTRPPCCVGRRAAPPPQPPRRHAAARKGRRLPPAPGSACAAPRPRLP